MPTDDADPSRAVEIAAARAWPAPRTAGIHGWLLRSTPGVDRARSNSALTPPTGPARVRDLDAVIGWLERHNGRARVMVSPLDRHPEVDAELARRGWGVQRAVDVLAGALADIDAPRTGPGTPRVRLLAAPAADWRAAWALCEGRPASEIEAEAATILAALGPRAAYALAEAGDGSPVGVGIAVTTGAWCGLFAMAARPDARRAGVGSAVLRTLAADARRRGASAAYLQVLTGNRAAQALYRRHGFARLHGYRTREAPESGSASPRPSAAPSSSPPLG